MIGAHELMPKQSQYEMQNAEELPVDTEKIDSLSITSSETVKEDSGKMCSGMSVMKMKSIDHCQTSEVISTEVMLEKQFESVQSQLLALKRLPSEIEKHLTSVTSQLYEIIKLSTAGVLTNGKDGDKGEFDDKFNQISHHHED